MITSLISLILSKWLGICWKRFVPGCVASETCTKSIWAFIFKCQTSIWWSWKFIGGIVFSIQLNICVTVMEYLCHKSPRLCSICRNHNPVLSSFMTYHRVCNQNTTADTILVKHELFTIPEHLRSLPALAGSCIALYIIVFWFHRLSFDHCVVCPSLIYAVWLPHWYLWSTASDYPIGIFDLRRLITPLVSLIYAVWLPHWYLWFTASDYPIGIFRLFYACTIECLPA